MAMLGKVVAEAALHAGGALVGCVQLDIGGGDADDFVVGNVQVHLAADAAIRADRAHDLVRMPDLLGREPLPRHHLEDRAGGANSDALSAPRTPRLVRVAVCADDDFGVFTAVSDVEHAHDLNVLARPHAARAQNTGRHVVADHRIAGALVARAQRQVAVLDGRRDDVVLHQIAFEFVARCAVQGWVPLSEKAENPFAVFNGGVRLGGHYHPVSDFGRAGRYELGLAFDRHQTNAAVADGGEFRIPAQSRDLDACTPGGIENGLIFTGGDLTPVNRQHRHAMYR